MGFREDLQRLSIQISERTPHITNEEMTKQSLIIPFIQTLGFDVFNPLEVRPEYDADFGKKKGEKVDYALFKDGQSIAFIEAKSVNENLLNHDAQLSRYFNAVPEVKLGIITNGVEYKFFTDLTADNIMDDKPFLVINFSSLKDSDIDNLLRFKKDTFDTESLVKYAEEIVYTSALDNSIKELLQNPNDEFIRFLIRDFSNSRVTTSVIERFRPLVKKAISNAVLDIVSKGLYREDIAPSPLNPIDASGEVATSINEDNENDNKSNKKQVITTEDELCSYDIIKNILIKADRNITYVNYKDTVNYFSIYNQNTTKWFIRLNLDSSAKNIITKLSLETAQALSNGFKIEQAPKGTGESRIFINSHEDIKKLENLILACFDEVAK